MRLVYQAIFYEDVDTKTYTIVFPDLPGCISQGDNFEEAFEMAEDVASGWILTAMENGEDIPKPTRRRFSEEENSFVNYVFLNIDEYAKKYSSKSVKKTLTIPQWLNTMAEKENINFSRLLQTALMQRLELISSSYANVESTIPYNSVGIKISEFSDYDFGDSESNALYTSSKTIRFPAEKRNIN